MQNNVSVVFGILGHGTSPVVFTSCLTGSPCLGIRCLIPHLIEVRWVCQCDGVRRKNSGLTGALFRAIDSVGGGWGSSGVFHRILVVVCSYLLRMTDRHKKCWQFFN